MSRRGQATAIGIDLGTTYSCVAAWFDQHNRVEILPNEQGNNTTPSCVACNDTELLVGEGAKNQITRNPINTVFGIPPHAWCEDAAKAVADQCGPVLMVEGMDPDCLTMHESFVLVHNKTMSIIDFCLPISVNNTSFIIRLTEAHHHPIIICPKLSNEKNENNEVSCSDDEEHDDYTSDCYEEDYGLWEDDLNLPETSRSGENMFAVDITHPNVTPPNTVENVSNSNSDGASVSDKVDEKFKKTATPPVDKEDANVSVPLEKYVDLLARETESDKSFEYVNSPLDFLGHQQIGPSNMGLVDPIVRPYFSQDDYNKYFGPPNNCNLDMAQKIKDHVVDSPGVILEKSKKSTSAPLKPFHIGGKLSFHSIIGTKNLKSKMKNKSKMKKLSGKKQALIIGNNNSESSSSSSTSSPSASESDRVNDISVRLGFVDPHCTRVEDGDVGHV
ncbi:heat shock protein 70 family, peptide-binding domain protein [Artemisia annua]|uniref:Heat shock protein 70 family, peptide-binding domain protein n=1 Tax=Artemisia annua TaxID=35608 RepID=A0A2U1MXM8_ARTAN|nr:heat shock protein 70 family, peptide-binding domain protein [Artemisia annua]